MIDKMIRFKNIEDAKDLVRLASSLDFDINLSYDKLVIDAKSIMGVLSMDLKRDFHLQYNGNSEELEKFAEDHKI